MSLLNPLSWNRHIQATGVLAVCTGFNAYVLNQEEQTNHHVIAVVAISSVAFVAIARIYEYISSQKAMIALGGITMLSSLASLSTRARSEKVPNGYLTLSKWTKDHIAKTRAQLQDIRLWADSFSQNRALGSSKDVSTAKKVVAEPTDATSTVEEVRTEGMGVDRQVSESALSAAPEKGVEDVVVTSASRAEAVAEPPASGADEVAGDDSRQ